MKSSCKELKEFRPYNEGLGGGREGTLFHAFQSPEFLNHVMYWTAHIQ